MARSAGTAYVDIEPRLDPGASRKISKGVESSIGGAVKRGLSGIGKTVTRSLKVGGLLAAGGAIGGIFATLKTGIGEVKESSEATAGLSSVLESTGNKAGVTVGHIDKLATSIEGYSGQADETIKKGAELLLTFTNIQNRVGKGNDIFDQATKLTADLAQRLGGDASAAAIGLGKALNDPIKGVTALRRVGVSFTKAQIEQIKKMAEAGDVLGAQKLVIRELNAEFGGAAKAFGTSVPGQIEKAKRAFEDFAEGIVTALAPVVLPIIKKVADAAAGLAPIITAGVKQITPALSTLAGAADEVFNIFVNRDFTGSGPWSEDSPIVDVLFKIRDRLEQLGLAIRRLVTQHLIPLGQAIVTQLGPPLLNIADQTRRVFRKVIIPLVAELADLIRTRVVPALRIFGNILGRVLEFIADHAPGVRTFAKVVLGLLLARLIAIKTVAAHGAILRYIEALKKAETPAAKVNKATLKFAKSVAITTVNIVKNTVATLAQKAASIAVAAGTKLWTAAQWLLNAAMTANPIGLIVAGVVALAAAVYLAYTRFEPFRNVVDATGRALAAAAQFVFEKVLVVFNWLKDHWPLVLVILTGPIGAAVVLIIRHWDKVKAATLAVFSAVTTIISTYVAIWRAIITTAFQAIAAVIGIAFTAVRTIVELHVTAIRTAIETTLAAVGLVWSAFWGGLHLAVDAAASVIKASVNGILSALEAIYNGFRDVWNAIELDVPGVKVAGKEIFGGFTFGLPDLPGVDLPSLAKGGVVTRPTLALLGETFAARPEITTPESIMRDVFRDELARGARVAETINFNGVEDAPDAVRLLTFQQRTRGRR